MSVNVGLYLDLRNPPPWKRPWHGFYGRALDHIQTAEALGISSVWLTEHHLFEDGYLPQPLTFAAAIAARTRRMRIGTAVVLAPLHRAVEVAEQAAIVDLLSDGRLELGLGAGYRGPEFQLFGEDISRRYALLEERATEIKRLWEDGGITPHPVQPQAPLWIGANGPRAARLAARLDAGMLTFAERAYVAYAEALATHWDGAAHPRLVGPANLIVADDPEVAWSRIRPHLAYQLRSYARYAAEGIGLTPGIRGASSLPASENDVDVDALRLNWPPSGSPGFDVVMAEDAVRRLEGWLAHLPVATVLFWRTIAGMPEDLAERHVELLATRVAPALAASAVGIATPAGG